MLALKKNLSLCVHLLIICTFSYFRVTAQNSTQQMNTMKGNGTVVNGVDGVACTTKMAPSMRESGTTISAMVKEWSV